MAIDELENISSWTSFQSLVKKNANTSDFDNQEKLERDILNEIEMKLKSADPDAMNEKDDIAVHSFGQKLHVSENKSYQVNFQIMTPHPTLFIDKASSNIVRDSAELVNRSYLKSSRKRTRSEENTFESSIVLPCYNDEKRSVDLDLPDISIPLTDLFHPPLLSEWIPGVETNISYKSTSAENRDGKEVDLIQKEKENKDIEKNEQDGMLTEKNRVLLGKLVATPQYTKQIKDWTEQEWMNHAPSQAILEQLKDFTRSEMLRAVNRFVGTYASDALGNHMIDVVLPILFESIAHITENETITSLLDELSCLLMYKCNLGTMSKSKLQKLSQSLTGNSVGIELKLLLSRNYFEYQSR
ncbi:predicted protein [Chaetoceros tenuissimus]|uniref:Uncharacterized protein n=1 Tax=Chaetoceros tenuissimus TaxID=426638 RepID=A0AAD3HC63_9STRA|nr:predicted protein [Chaetoceros tenuissimus]